MGKALLEIENSSAKEKSVVRDLLALINFHCVKVSEERAALEKSLLDADYKRKKAANSLKRFQETKASITNLKEKKERFDELQEVNQQLSYFEGSHANVLIDIQDLNTELVGAS